MAYTLSDDEGLIRKVVREFARDQVGLEAAHDRDRYDTFPSDVIAAAAGLGLTGMSVPEASGGAGTTPTALAVAIDELAQVDPALASIIATHNQGALLLARAGSPVTAAAAGGEVVAVLATEESGGSDKGSMVTVAEPDGDRYMTLTGQKVWALGAAGAEHFVVLAEVADAGPTLFHVPADAEGVQLGRAESLLGLRAAGIRTVYLSEVIVSADAMLGDAGTGRSQLDDALPLLQVGVSAAICGAIDGALDAAREFAATRIQFSEPVGTYQAVSDSVTSIDIGVHAARALTFAAAARLDEEDAAIWAARAKAFAADIAAPLTRRAIRVQGGTGFMREGGTERFARDVRCLWGMGEPPHVQRDTLKRALIDIEYDATP